MSPDLAPFARSACRRTKVAAKGRSDSLVVLREKLTLGEVRYSDPLSLLAPDKQTISSRAGVIVETIAVFLTKPLAKLSRIWASIVEGHLLLLDRG